MRLVTVFKQPDKVMHFSPQLVQLLLKSLLLKDGQTWKMYMKFRALAFIPLSEHLLLLCCGYVSPTDGRF